MLEEKVAPPLRRECGLKPKELSPIPSRAWLKRRLQAWYKEGTTDVSYKVTDSAAPWRAPDFVKPSEITAGPRELVRYTSLAWTFKSSPVRRSPN